ncbi:MAG: ATP phosphoribosyltransferase regulatory subunit [Rhodospirillaceae bacterium]|nr:ATP phosphoribosyltransferase regulatory subunit [Rhodospirillaceae bacterium]
MTDNANRALLPAGLRDLLPPHADHEAAVVAQLMRDFAAQGYERVKPPLIEFEESLLSGSGKAMAKQTFRVMDPVSQRMMGLRSDMTLQTARIATTRLVGQPRPLRLSYAGQVLRVKGSQLRPERQFGQAGIELIGVDNAAADAEVIALAVRSLRDLGIDRISVDLAMPTLVGEIVAELGGGEDLKEAIDYRDVAAALAAKSGPAKLLARLIEAVGPAGEALARLKALDLPPKAALLRERLAQVLALLERAAPDLKLTIDPVESRGFDYQIGLAFTLFARGHSGEIGRGGRYRANGESAVGATLFMDTVLEAAPEQPSPRRLFVPLGTDAAQTERLRAEGWVTLAGLSPVEDPIAEARRMGCSHALVDGVLAAAN